MQRQVRYLQGRLDLLNRPNTPGFVRRFFAHTNFCVGAASVLLAILLTKSIVTLARPAWTNNYGWLHYISQAVQFISGFLLFLIALAFVPSMRSLHNLITTYMQEDSVRQVAEEDVLSELEAEGLAADEALSTRRQRGARLLHSDLIRSDHALFLDEENPPVQQRQQRGAAGGPHGLHNVADAGGTAGEHTLQPSSPSATVFEAILLCVANALLVCVTAISVVLRTPFIALLLYSLGARLVEILLVSVILRSIARESRLLPGTSSPPIMSPTSAQPLTGFTTKNVVPMQSALATTAGDVPSAAGTSYPNPSFDDSAGDSVHMEHAPPPLQRGVVHIASRENISPALTTRSSGLGPPPSSAPARYHPPPSSPAVAAGASRGAGRNGTDDRAPGAAVRAYNKRWPWIFTPSNDIPSRKVETDAPKRVKVKSFSAPASYDKCRNDSPDDDSTDSGLQYFK